jgi:hypothetical protein
MDTQECGPNLLEFLAPVPGLIVGEIIRYQTALFCTANKQGFRHKPKTTVSLELLRSFSSLLLSYTAYGAFNTNSARQKKQGATKETVFAKKRQKK